MIEGSRLILNSELIPIYHCIYFYYVRYMIYTEIWNISLNIEKVLLHQVITMMNKCNFSSLFSRRIQFRIKTEDFIVALLYLNIYNDII